MHASISSSLFSCFGLNVSKISLIASFGICPFYVFTVLRAKSYIYITVMNDLTLQVSIEAVVEMCVKTKDYKKRKTTQVLDCNHLRHHQCCTSETTHTVVTKSQNSQKNIKTQYSPISVIKDFNK